MPRHLLHILSARETTLRNLKWSREKYRGFNASDSACCADANAVSKMILRVLLEWDIEVKKDYALNDTKIVI